MVNYKGTLQETIIIGGRVYPIQTGETIKILYAAKTGTAALNLKDSLDNAAYSVPAGKTFKAIGWYAYVATVSTITIFQGDTEDAETLTKYNPTFYIAAKIVEEPLDFTIAASKFVVYDTVNSVDSQALIIGVEK